MYRYRVPVVLVLALFLQAQESQSTAQLQPFRTATQLVPIYATVTDDDDRLVTDLVAENFQVFDDGKPQPLALFENSAQPITVVLLLDTSASMTLAIERMAAAAEQFVFRLLPHDRALLCVINDRIAFSADFTADRDELARDIREMDYGNGKRFYDGLAASLDKLKTIGGRKIIVVFTDGEDTVSKASRREITDRARADNVMLYAIGIASYYINDNGERVDVRPHYGLKKLAAETGGGYFVLLPSTDPSAAFTRIGKELHGQYALAIAPTAFDGRVHKLRVRVARANLSVRARHAYLAARPRPADQR